MTTLSSILAWENPMDRGVWRATVHGVAESRTWLKRLITAHRTPPRIFTSANKENVDEFTWTNKENVDDDLSKLITCTLLGLIFQINTDAPGNLTKMFQCEIFPVTCLICMCVSGFEVDTLMFVLSHSPVNTILSISGYPKCSASNVGQEIEPQGTELLLWQALASLPGTQEQMFPPASPDSLER